MSVNLGASMRIVRPYPNIIAFYDGRIPGVRAHSESFNWLDDGAFTLGTSSFAIVEGREAIVYDTHMSLAHARIIRRTLEDVGVRDMRVVLSHWHTDHVAGNEVFADCEIIANSRTVEAMTEHRAELEGGDPPIRPLVMPTTSYDKAMDLRVGGTALELRHLDIHSYDETAILLPGSGVLLCGDTLEDTVTYVTEPERLTAHLGDLGHMATWDFSSILPNHGTLEKITAGGYGRDFIDATRLYVERLEAVKTDRSLADPDLRTFAAEALATGAVSYFEPYEPVHRRNLEAVLAVAPQ
jgi:glyoxylase-like metal-dependent hydrolase (beta-lactamase superfamily II)